MYGILMRHSAKRNIDFRSSSFISLRAIPNSSLTAALITLMTPIRVLKMDKREVFIGLVTRTRDLLRAGLALLALPLLT